MMHDVVGGSIDRRSRSTVAQGTDSIRNNEDRRGLQSEVLVELMVTTMINRSGGAEGFTYFLSTRPGWAGDYISRYLGQKQIDLSTLKRHQRPSASLSPTTSTHNHPEPSRPPRNSYGPVRWISLTLRQTTASSASRVDTQRSRKSVSVQSNSPWLSLTHIPPCRRRYIEPVVLATKHRITHHFPRNLWRRVQGPRCNFERDRRPQED